MEAIGNWILSVTAAAMVIAGAEALMPPGGVKRVGKLTGGLILMLVLLQPLVKLEYEDLLAPVGSLPAGAMGQEELASSAWKPMKGIIEEEFAAYIVDKGKALGLTCRAQVTCTLGEGGVPLPQGVTVTGPMDEDRKEALIKTIAQDLGIPREDQIYVSEEVP